MKLIVGLGNPGEQYARTPHNLGFMAVDSLADRLGAEWKADRKFQALVAKVLRKGQPLWLMKPQTYMNRSGESVGPFLKYYGATGADVIVLSDDADLPPGRIRVRPSGSAGGHNGLRSIIEALGTQVFARIRLGVGRAQEPRQAMVDFVLHRFSPEEAETAAKTAALGADAALCCLDSGVSEAQNRYNAAQSND